MKFVVFPPRPKTFPCYIESLIDVEWTFRMSCFILFKLMHYGSSFPTVIQHPLKSFHIIFLILNACMLPLTLTTHRLWMKRHFIFFVLVLIEAGAYVYQYLFTCQNHCVPKDTQIGSPSLKFKHYLQAWTRSGYKVLILYTIHTKWWEASPKFAYQIQK